MRVAVVGAGIVGMSATAALLARGVDVTCYERSGAVMAERSAGSSRIFRFAHTSPALVRLAQAARAGFRAWEERAGTQMIGDEECVVSTPDVADRAAAMESAGVPYELVDGPSERLRVPAAAPPAAAVVDPSGGVIDVDAVRAHLVARAGHAVVPEPVSAVEDAAVWTPAGRTDVDAVVLAAGCGTPPLAEQVGIAVPRTLAHHVRFTFPIAVSGPWRCWIDKPADAPGTYQHLTGPGRWSVGGAVDPALTAWEVGREAAAEASRDAVTRYVRDRLLAEPRVVESLYCTHVPDLGDGFTLHRSGNVVALTGENLFKFAPLLGEVLAQACLEGTTPTLEELAARVA